MVYILAAGHSQPNHNISPDTFLQDGEAEDLGRFEKLLSSTFLNRKSILPESVFGSGFNAREIIDGFKELEGLESPTDLALASAKEALKAGGLGPEQIGLVWGECATPLQITPSEAQRVAGALGLKVPAYDVGSPGLGMLRVLSILQTWKLDRTPEFVLSVNVATPTRALDYSAGPGRFIFGDCAGSFVCSKHHKGKFRVLASKVFEDYSLSEQFVLPTYGNLSLSKEFISKVLPSLLRAQVSKFMEVYRELDAEHTKLIVSPLCYPSAYDVMGDLGFAENNHLANYTTFGECFGASHVSVLSDFWDEFSRDDRILVVGAGPGIAIGLLWLECLY